MRRLQSEMLRAEGDLTLADLSVLAKLEQEFQEILGFERGYNQEADIITQTADGADLNAMWREFQASVALQNRQRDPLVNLLTFQVASPTERVLQPSGEDFEEASEFGEPKGIRLGVPFLLGFPHKWYDLAIRYTWMFLAEATRQQVEGLNAQALEADNRLMFTRVLRAIFNNVNETATINEVAVNVYRLYNADGTVPPPYKGTTFNGTHTHYLTSGAATIDSGDLDDMEEHLYHHGYRLNLGYRLVLLANRQEATVIRTFKVADGDKYDFIPASDVGGGVILPLGTVVGAPGGSVPGMIGTYGPWLVVEEDYIPAGYVLGFATGGDRNIGNLVGIREHEQASLRGLRLVKGPTPDYPLIDSFYHHGLGAGIRHRGAGVVMQIAVDPTYDIPANYV